MHLCAHEKSVLHQTQQQQSLTNTQTDRFANSFLYLNSNRNGMLKNKTEIKTVFLCLEAIVNMSIINKFDIVMLSFSYR